MTGVGGLALAGAAPMARELAARAGSERVLVHVSARDEAVRDRVLTVVRRSGFGLAPEPDGAADTVVVAAARTVDGAIAQCPTGSLVHGGWLLIAETFAPPEALRAVRAGAATMLRTANVTPERFAAAVHAAHRGDGLIPHEVLVRLLGGAAAQTPAPAAARPAPATSLTNRQVEVLALIADGHGNASIARALACSQHTVKNVIYDMTARLQVRNRAQAVARGVRAGLI